MIYVDRILFPTDGSDCAEQARRHATHLADHFDATLHVIHVEERDVEPADVVEIDEADLLADLHSVSGGGLPLLAESRVQQHVVTYPAAAGGILTYGVEHDVDLVVLGTHGHRGVRRLMLGSVAEEVVRKAPCPVVTVGRGAVAPDALEGGIMLVPVDFSEYQDRLLAHVREIAPVYGMTVTVLHVVEVTGVPDAYGTYSSLPDPGTLGNRAERVLDEKVDPLRADGIEVSVAVKSGHPAPQTLAVAEEIDATFIAIATHGRTGVERMLMGSVAEKVIRRAPCPVCTVKSFGPSLVASEDGAE